MFKVESGFRFVSPFLALYYIYTTTKKHGWHLDFLTLKSKIRDRWDHLIAIMGFESLLLIVIIGSLVSLLLLFVSDALMVKLESLMAQSGPEEKKFSVWIMMDDFIAVVLLGFLMEEILFRGFLYDGIKNKGQKYTMILSVLALGLAHGGVLPHLYIYTKLRQQSGDIYGGLILHSFNNFLVFMAGMITLEYL